MVCAGAGAVIHSDSQYWERQRQGEKGVFSLWGCMMIH